MANDKKNMNILVPTDDDPTEELEVLEFSGPLSDDESEVSATTTGYVKDDGAVGDSNDEQMELASEIREREETIDRLQFDLEVLQAKWRGLSTEVEARDEQANRLNAELKATKQAVLDVDRRLAERDEEIGKLQNGIESRDIAYRELAERLSGLQQADATDGRGDAQNKNQMLEEMAGQLASRDLETRELHIRLARIEEYADELRYQLRLKNASADELQNKLEAAEQQLVSAIEQTTTLRAELGDALRHKSDLEQKITSLNDTHAEEIRTIRFELGDAQATLTEHESVAEQLANDLVQTRGLREELETKLAKAEEKNRNRIAALETENKKLRVEAEASTEQLRTKSEAINALLSELASASKKTETSSEIDDAISKIEDRVAEHVDDSAYVERDRVARLLIGNIDDQELRFPLFKDRLTIGRTDRNDIQLKSPHVSRRHAVVVIEGDVTRVIDWGSKNGVFVNARRIKEHFLQNGDVVGVGKAEFRYEERPMRDA